jgi:1-acyl-sn-glycerol-3-phosphate acyltransferase
VNQRLSRSEDSERILFYRFARALLFAIVHCIYRYRVVDADYMPSSGPALLASNHVHNFDPPILGLSTRRFVHFMAKEELFRWSLFGQMIRSLGAFPVKRGSGDMTAMRQAITIPKSGGCLVVFPEGHRSKDGRLGKGRPGAAFIARKAGCPIVPAVIIGHYRLFRPLTIRYGPPIIPTDDDTNESLTMKLMTEFERLLASGHSKR